MEFGNSLLGGAPFTELNDETLMIDIWKQIQEVAHRFYEPGKFTTFVGYEWSCNPEGNGLHRNVIFRGTQVPERPFTTFDSMMVEDLWSFMETQREHGIQVLAIPHNPNYSDGLMFQVVDSHGQPIDRTYAQRRQLNEPLVEITQLKGQSEAHPALSPTDEMANYFISDIKMTGDFGSLRSQPKGSYVRDALRTGLVLEEQTGVNPYKFGVVGGSDTHNAGAAYEEDNFFGKIGHEDGTPEARLGDKHVMSKMVHTWGSAGLGGSVGRGEHARGTLRRHGAQGNLRHLRPPHQGAFLRRMGFFPGRPLQEGLDRGRVQTRRADGKRPLEIRRKARRLPSSSGQPKTPTAATSTASRSSRAGPNSDRASRKCTTSSGRVTGR